MVFKWRGFGGRPDASVPSACQWSQVGAKLAAALLRRLDPARAPRRTTGGGDGQSRDFGFPMILILGVDSNAILLHHRSFQKPDLFFWVFDGFLKKGSLERMGKVALESWVCLVKDLDLPKIGGCSVGVPLNPHQKGKKHKKRRTHFVALTIALGHFKVSFLLKRVM